MKRISSLLPLLALTAVFLFVFSEPMFSDRTLFSPDSPPVYKVDFPSQHLQDFYACWDPGVLGTGTNSKPFYPNKLLPFLFPPLTYHLWSYILSVAFTAASTMFYLRGHGIRGLAMWAGGTAMAFSGYHFTLISAGHRGIFEMTGWVLLVFATLDRCITQKRWIYFPVLGACVAHAMGAQPDLTMIYLLPAVAYGILLLIRRLRTEPFGGEIKRLLPGGALMLLTFILLSLNTIGNLRTNIIPHRKSDQGSSAEQKWIYATNWSLPPEEAFEFIIPGIYGKESGDKQHPYWGRVGRAHRWEETKQGLFNLKQHTVYLGILQLCIAGYLVIRVFALKKAEEPNSPLPRWLILFWLSVSFAAFLFALGRYAPFYHLIYALPKFSTIRAPIKFVHLIEWATALLFAGGVAAIAQDIQNGAWKRIRNLSIGFFGIAGSVVLIFLISTAKPASVAELLNQPALAPQLASSLQAGVLHSLILSLTAGGLFFAMSRWRKSSDLAMWSLFILLLLDLAIVAKPYVHTRDMAALYKPNPIAASLRATTPPPRVSWRTGTPMSWQHPLFASFFVNGGHYLEPRSPKQIDDRTQKILDKLPQSISGYLRLLDLSATTRILANPQFASLLDRIPKAKRLESFSMLQGGGVTPTAAERAQTFLYQYDALLPRASVMYQWEAVEAEDIPKRLFDPAWDPTNIALIESDFMHGATPTDTATASSVSFDAYSEVHSVLSGSAQEEGILVLRDRWHEKVKVTVNGKKASTFPVNYVTRGVRVPKGRFEVTMQYAPFRLPLILNFSTLILLTGFVLFDTVRSRS